MLEVRGLTKSFGALRATDGIDLEVREGETHAIIGPNGAGKTIFIGQLAGNLRPDGGRILFAGEDITHLPPRAARAKASRARSRSRASIRNSPPCTTSRSRCRRAPDIASTSGGRHSRTAR